MSKRNRGTRSLFILVLLAGVLAPEFFWCDGGEPNGLSATAAAQILPYVDDGRYDYGLSQPDSDIKVKAELNVDITLSDGTILKGDVFRPDIEGRFPVIMGEAPYPRAIIGTNAGVDDNGGAGTEYQGFEQLNPDYYIPRGYVYVTYSPRGYGGSEGKTSVLTAQERWDNYDAIEWAAEQSWSDGNIGLFGISYYAMFQYYVAARPPPALKAIVPWEGLADPYRDIAYRGGIPCAFGNTFGSGMSMLADDQTKAYNYPEILEQHPLFDEVWEYGASVLEDPESNDIKVLDILTEIGVPMLSIGQLADPDLHLHGNQTAFMATSDPDKKLLLYTGTHWGSAYQPWANRTVLRFFDHWLKGIDTGLDKEPAVDVQLRTTSDTFTHIYGDDWPLKRTEWTKYYLDASDQSLSTAEPKATSSVEAEFKDEPEIGSSDQVTFSTAPLKKDVTVVGPMSAHFWVSSSTEDVDLTVELRSFDADGQETRYDFGAWGDRAQPVTRGWLRASLRALDPERTTEHLPFHSYRKNEWLTPGVPVAVDVEILPTGSLFKAGHRIALTIHCGYYTRVGAGAMFQSYSPESGTTEIHTGGEYASWLDLPVVPADTAAAHQISVNDGDFSPKRVTGEMGDRFEWTNDGEDYHSATESSGLNLWDSQLIRGSRSHNPETWWTQINWAGTFDYRDMVAGWGFSGAIEIPVGVPESVESGSATIVLGTTPPPDGTGFDVQLQKDGEKWSSIATGVTSTEITTETLDGGKYAARARLTSLSDTEVETDWSPKATFTMDESPEGCGCRAVRASNSSGIHPYQWLAGLLLLALVFRRRRL